MMKLRQSEINRACDGYTIAVRPQRGGVMVATVWIETGEILWSQIVKNGEVQTEVREQLRTLDKLGGGGNMASRSRHRTGEKWNKQHYSS